MNFLNRIKHIIFYSLNIGSIAEIKIGIHWSLPILMLFVTNAAYDIVTMRHPDATLFSAILLSAVIAIGLSASILMHELAHALVAKKLGLTCKGIRLYLFGGIADVGGKFVSAKQELLISAAGPIASILIGIVLLLIASQDINSVSQMSFYGHMATGSMILGAVNLAVGIFNTVVCIFPTDSGRILRALIWMATGDFEKATRFATRLGIGCSRGFILYGCLMFFGFNLPILGSGHIMGILIVCIGLILIKMAKKERNKLSL